MTTTDTEGTDQVSRRTFITLSVMLATIMQALDTTIANVAVNSDNKCNAHGA